MATEAFLKLGNLRGESTVLGFEDQIELLSWDWGMSQASSAHWGAGGGAGAVDVEDLGFRHEIDAASPALVLACCRGTHFSQGTLTVRKAGGATALPYLLVKLNDIIVTSISHAAIGDGERYIEDVTLNFAAFEVSYQKQDNMGAKAGGAVSIEYDIARSTGSAAKKVFRKGSRGHEVQQLQAALTERGFPVPQTGFYGDMTEAAVYAFQSKHGLYPDGIAGPRTLSSLECTAPVAKPLKAGAKPQVAPATRPSAVKSMQSPAQRVQDNLQGLIERFGLEVYRAAAAARHQSPLRLQESAPRSHPVAGMTLSEPGKRFLFEKEAWRGVSERLHWPGGASGVTLGAGFDMKERSKAQVAQALKGIGVDAKVADQVSEAAGLHGEQAEKFTKKHRSLVSLTPQQEWKIMELVLPTYEKAVKRAIRVDLRQHQFDALVSFAYNTGSVFSKIARYVNAGEHKSAAAAIETATPRNPKLKPRRLAEAGVYRSASYGKPSAFTRLAAEK